MDNFDIFISDEMLAAYIDGNAIPIEQNIIDGYLDCDELQEVLDIVSDIKANPELVELGEDLNVEVPDNIFEGFNNPLQDLKQELENPGKKIM